MLSCVHSAVRSPCSNLTCLPRSPPGDWSFFFVGVCIPPVFTHVSKQVSKRSRNRSSRLRVLALPPYRACCSRVGTSLASSRLNHCAPLNGCFRLPSFPTGEARLTFFSEHSSSFHPLWGTSTHRIVLIIRAYRRSFRRIVVNVAQLPRTYLQELISVWL